MFELRDAPETRDAPVTIRPVLTWRDRHRFVRFPHRLYEDDPHYRTQPDLLELQRITPGLNPWFEHGEAAFFLACRDGEVVGRISAQIDYEHLRYHDDATGFFGLFECIDDRIVAASLLEVAEDWCRNRGLERIRGPFNLSINDESGMLVEGFESPNYVMMPHGRRCYPDMLEQCGYDKAMDLYAWRFEREQLPERVAFIADDVADFPGLELRSLDMEHLERDIEIIMDIFNDAWSDNWGFIPMTEAEIREMAEEFKLVVDPELCLIAEHEGEPAAMAVAIPNINEVFADLDGRLFPTGWARALYRFQADPPRSFRCILLGIREAYRGTALGGLSVLLYATIHRRAYDKGYREAEASWTLEDNEGINDGMEFMGAEHYKTYRIYERALEG
jgi:GNAT superfamily N-acetyltransferase